MTSSCRRWSSDSSRRHERAREHDDAGAAETAGCARTRHSPVRPGEPSRCSQTWPSGGASASDLPTRRAAGVRRGCERAQSRRWASKSCARVGPLPVSVSTLPALPSSFACPTSVWSTVPSSSFVRRAGRRRARPQRGRRPSLRRSRASTGRGSGACSRLGTQPVADAAHRLDRVTPKGRSIFSRR